MTKMIHSMIRVFDDEKSIKFYQDALDFGVVDVLDFESFRLIYLKTAENEFELELTLNKGQKEPYQIGDGYGHLAVSVADLAQKHQQIADLGYTPGKIIDFAPDGELVGRFFFVADPDGYKIEVIERGGRFK